MIYDLLVNFQKIGGKEEIYDKDVSSEFLDVMITWNGEQVTVLVRKSILEKLPPSQTLVVTMELHQMYKGERGSMGKIWMCNLSNSFQTFQWPFIRWKSRWQIVCFIVWSLVSAKKKKKMSWSHERLCLSIDFRMFPAFSFFQWPGCGGGLIVLHSWEKNCTFVFFFFTLVHWTAFVMQGLCLDWMTKIEGFFFRNAKA